MLVSATVSESCSTIISSIKTWHSKDTGSSVGYKSLWPVKWNVELFKDRPDVVLEVFLLSTNTSVA